jgi:serine/threonine-protein kinase
LPNDLPTVVEKTDVLPPTRTLGGKYRLGRLLGEGGMGTVYEAEHTGLGSRVAIKLLTERFAGDEDALARFRREARASAAVRHENVVRVTDTGTDEEGVPFLVMELLEGESLNAVLKRNRRLEPETAAVIASEVLDGLAAAHDQGIVHRDLKPGNVFLTRDVDGRQRAKILDFGISKFGSDTTREITVEGAVVGTPQYMPPEQVSGERDLDARADIYAAGVLLYRMTTGRLPFTAESPNQLYRQILAGKATPPRDLVPGMSRELERVIVKAMATDRERRFADARAFRHALLEAVPSAPSRIPTLTPAPSADAIEPPGPSTAPTVRARRLREQQEAGGGSGEAQTQRDSPRWLFWLGAALVLAIGGVGAAFWAQAGDADSPTASQPAPDEPAPASDGEPETDPSATAIAGDGDAIRYGISGYNPREMVVEDHAPLVEYLSKQLDQPVKMEVVDAYLDLAGKLIDGDVQLAALSAASYVRAKRREPGIELLATPVRHGGPSYRGYILVRADSDIRELSELKGKDFCYVNRQSTSGYLYPRALFRKEGIDPDGDFFGSTTFTNHHLGALKTLHEGGCDAAAVYANMLLVEAREHHMSPESFHILAGTERIPYDAYCVPPNQPPELTERLKAALLALEPGSEAAERVFDAHDAVTGFAPAKDSDYDPVRDIEQFLDD